MPDPDPNKSANEGTKLTVKLEDGTEKNFDAKDVQNLLAQQASATQKTQQVAAVMKICEKYGAKPEDFARQADAMFERVTAWREDGFLDDNWNIVKGKSGKSDETNAQVTTGKATLTPSASAFDSKSEDLIAEAIKPYQDKVQKLEGAMGQLIDMNLQKEVVSRFPELDVNDARKALFLSRQDRTKDLTGHCQALVEEKKQTNTALRQKFADEFGVDLKTFDENKLNQQGADGGMLPMFKGKHFSLNAKKGDKEKIQPLDAAIAYIEAKAAASV